MEFRFSKDGIVDPLEIREDRYFWIWIMIEMKKIKWNTNFDFLKIESFRN